MAETLEWLPKASPVILPFTGTSYPAVRQALERCFGEFPLQLSIKQPAHVAALSGMMSVHDGTQSPYRVLYEALKQFGEIEIRDSF